MARRARPLSSVEVAEGLFDFSVGVFGGQTDAATRTRHLRYADNIEFEPIRGFSLRKGSRDLNGAVMPAAGHSLMAFYASNGVPTFFCASADKIYKLGPSSNTLQSLPVTPTSGKWTHVNLNGVLIAAQAGSGNPPIFYDGSTWMSCVPPTPAAPTLTSMTAGGAVDAGVHFYRVRYLFLNSASIANISPLSVTVAGPNFIVNLALPAAPAGRTDYVGVRIERTQAGGAVGGPYYFVANVLTPTVAYADVVSDAALTERVQPGEPGSSGPAPALDGITAFRSRLVGFKGSNLYVGQGISDAQGSGIMNFNPAQQYPIKKDDGDPIQLLLNTPGERLIVLKGASGHALDGDDPDNFAITQIFDGVGAAGPRAAAIVANRLVFYAGQGRIMQHSGTGDPVPFGDLAVGHYLKKIAASADPDVLLFNYRGTHLFVAYTESPDTYNRHALVYRTAYRNWTHWKDWRMSDALAPKRPENAGGVTILFADPKSIDGSQNSTAGSNPSFVVWNDRRVSPSQKYVQKILSTGQAAWTANGVLLSAAAFDSYDSIGRDAHAAVYGVADGGCVVVYAEAASASQQSLRVQRLDSLGAKQWGASGIVISNVAGLQHLSYYTTDMRVISDGGTGFIVVWTQYTTALHEYRVYAQKLNAAGAAQWAANGVEVCPDAGAFDNGDEAIVVLPDGAGGFYIGYGAHEDLTGNAETRFQRVSTSGTLMWGATGVASGFNFTLSRGHTPVCVSSDGFLHSLFASPTTALVQVRRYNKTTGATVWTSSGLDPTMSKATYAHTFIIAGIDGKTLAFWAENKTTATQVILRFIAVDSSGAAIGTATTLKTFSGADPQSAATSNRCLRAVESGAGAAIVVFTDARTAVPRGLYVTKVNEDGLQPWGSQLTVTPAATTFSVATDGNGGAIVAFDNFGGPNVSINVSRVRSTGAIEWAAGGLPLRSGGALAGSAAAAPVNFTLAAESQFPAGTFLGYHVWSGFSGYSDEAAVDGTGGIPIIWMIETPEMDAGAPDVLKEFTRFELLVKTGLGSIGATLTLDAGNVVNVALAASRSSAKWGKRGVATKQNTLIWGPKSGSSPNPSNPRKWAGQRSQNISVGLPDSTVGTRWKIALRGALQSEMLIEGFTTDYRSLPERPYT